MMTEETRRQEDTLSGQDGHEFCPLCNVLAVRRIRGKIHCGNCGYIES
jgi:ribosomal protein S27AE